MTRPAVFAELVEVDGDGDLAPKCTELSIGVGGGDELKALAHGRGDALTRCRPCPFE